MEERLRNLPERKTCSQEISRCGRNDNVIYVSWKNKNIFVPSAATNSTKWIKCAPQVVHSPKFLMYKTKSSPPSRVPIADTPSFTNAPQVLLGMCLTFLRIDSVCHFKESFPAFGRIATRNPLRERGLLQGDSCPTGRRVSQ